MSFSNISIMRASREALNPHWGLGVLISFIYVVIIGSSGYFVPNLSELIPLLFAGPFSLGFAYFSFSVIHDKPPYLGQLFEGFQSYGKSFLAYLVFSILAVVGFILLIIPGIIISLGLGMTFYVMADRPDLSFIECIQESWRLMRDQKLKFLGLNLRFFPWYLLGILCLGVGVLFVIPWHYASCAKFYNQIKSEN